MNCKLFFLIAIFAGNLSSIIISSIIGFKQFFYRSVFSLLQNDIMNYKMFID